MTFKFNDTQDAAYTLSISILTISYFVLTLPILYMTCVIYYSSQYRLSSLCRIVRRAIVTTDRFDAEVIRKPFRTTAPGLCRVILLFTRSRLTLTFELKRALVTPARKWQSSRIKSWR